MDPNLMLQFEMMKTLRHMQSRKRVGQETADDSDSEADAKRHRDFDGVDKLRRRFENRPDRLIKEFVEMSKEELGVTSSSQLLQLTHLAERRKADFGNMRGLYRVYHATCHLV